MLNNWIDSRFRPAMGEYVFDLLIITGSGFLEYFIIRRWCILFLKFGKKSESENCWFGLFQKPQRISGFHAGTTDGFVCGYFMFSKAGELWLYIRIVSFDFLENHGYEL